MNDLLPKMHRIWDTVLVPFVVLLVFNVFGGQIIRLLGIDPVDGTIMLDLAAFAVGVAVVVARNIRTKGYVLVRANKLNWMGCSLILVLAVGAWWGGQILGTGWYQWFGDPLYDAYTAASVTGRSAWSLVLLTLVAAPLCEETLLRGFAFGHWQRYNTLFAIVMSTAVFAMMHGTVVHLWVTAPIGLVLALTRAVSGRVLPCILIHMLFNWLSLIQGSASVPSWMTGHTGFITLATIMAIIMVAGVWVTVKHPAWLNRCITPSQHTMWHITARERTR